MKTLLLVFALSSAALLPKARAHSENGDEAQSLIEPIAFGLPQSRVTISEKDGKRIIESNDIPNHETGKFPNLGNPNTIQPQSYHYEVTLHPAQTGRITELKQMDFGVAINGVKFDPATAEFWNHDRTSVWNEEAIVKGVGKLGIDWSNAHVQPSGAYHYHGVPNGLIKQLHGEGKMILLGWAADGFPIYGPWSHKDPKVVTSPLVEMKSSYRLKNGNRPGGKNAPGGRYDGTYTVDFEYVAGLGTLDECNGRFGPTPEHPERIYYYVLTTDFPFIPRKYRGSPDPSFQHHPPPGGRGGFGRPGQGPRDFPPPPGPPL